MCSLDNMDYTRFEHDALMKGVLKSAQTNSWKGSGHISNGYIEFAAQLLDFRFSKMTTTPFWLLPVTPM